MNRFKKIYVISPYGLVTGGPDALHQIVYYLRGIGCVADLVYSDIVSRKYKIPEPYQCYINDYSLVKDIEDNADNAIIVPETLCFYLNKFKNIKKYIWWLSVDNNSKNSGFFTKLKKICKKLNPLMFLRHPYKIRTFINYTKNKKYSFSDETVTHLCASYYAYDYVRNNLLNKEEFKQKFCIEPLSKYFLEHSCNEEKSGEKEDIVIYNPKKNFKFTKKIIKSASDINFIALKGFSQKALVNIYSRAKVYIDFGWFPGAERIPKEAVLNGCIVITGRNGASSFHGDVPIPEEYKIDSKKENIDKIIRLIKNSLKEYDEKVSYFEEYKNTVLNLEENFIRALIAEFTETTE